MIQTEMLLPFRRDKQKRKQQRLFWFFRAAKYCCSVRWSFWSSDASILSLIFGLCSGHPWSHGKSLYNLNHKSLSARMNESNQPCRLQRAHEHAPEIKAKSIFFKIHRTLLFSRLTRILSRVRTRQKGRLGRDLKIWASDSWQPPWRNFQQYLARLFPMGHPIFQNPDETRNWRLEVP